jgi:hypothetical protein
MPSRNQIIGAVSSICLLPSFILTVVPTFARGDPGLAVCMAIAVAGLPLVPFAIRRSQDLSSRAGLIMLGLILLLYNFSNALDALNGSHTLATGPARERMAAAAALDKKISELGVRKDHVEQHKIGSRESALAAQAARDAECKTGYGAKCRAREDELRAAQHDWTLTERAETIEASLDRAKADLAALGPIETTADPAASQLASLFALAWPSAAGSGDAISTYRPVFRASVVELMGGLGPWVLMLIFGTAVAAAKPKPKLRKNILPASKDSVHQWHGERIESREGRSLRAGDAFADYTTWCVGNKLASVNQVEFGETLKNELGVKSKRGTNNRTSYLDVSLKLVAVGSASDRRQTGVKPPGRIGKRGKVEATAPS